MTAPRLACFGSLREALNASRGFNELLRPKVVVFCVQPLSLSTESPRARHFRRSVSGDQSAPLVYTRSYKFYSRIERQQGFCSLRRLCPETNETRIGSRIHENLRAKKYVLTPGSS
jgi:hypothetical protein